MMTRRLSALLAVGMAVSGLSACGNNDTLSQISSAAQAVLRSAREAIDAVRAYANEHKDEVRATLEEKFQNLSEGIRTLKARIAKAGQQAKPAWEEALRVLQDKKDAVREKLVELKGAGERGWERLKPQIEKAIDELEKAYQRCREQFR